MLGVYLTAHPLDEYAELWQSSVTAKTTDFVVDPETGVSPVRDGSRQVIGGLISGKTIKNTKNNQVMAFVTIEDLVGSVEVICFPRDYEKYRNLLNPEEKVFVQGRVSVSDDDVTGKLICEQIVPFFREEKTLWVRYADKAAYDADIASLMLDLGSSEGEDEVKIYLGKEKQMRCLGPNWRVRADEGLADTIRSRLGEENVKIVTKPLKTSAVKLK